MCNGQRYRVIVALRLAAAEQGRRNWGCWGCYSIPNISWSKKLLAFSTLNISKSKESAALKKSLVPPIFYTFRRAWYVNGGRH